MVDTGQADTSDDAALAATLLAAYDLTPPIAVYPLPDAGGINNAVRAVRTGAGEFIWKRYAAHGDPAAIAREYRLLARLAEARLSFAVPLPLPARDGATTCPLPDGAGWGVLAARLPGGPLNRHDLPAVATLGAALGELHRAFARLQIAPSLQGKEYGDLRRIHPALPDPFTLTPSDLGLPAASPHVEDLSWLRDFLAELAHFIAGPYRVLPRQIIHGDFGPGNALFADGRTVAILDFEFALRDARALDVAAALFFVMRTWERESGAALAFAGTFCAGYARQSRLTGEEVAALPSLILLRDTVALIWWLGRALAAGDVRPSLDRLTELRELACWVAAHGAGVVAAVKAAQV